MFSTKWTRYGPMHSSAGQHERTLHLPDNKGVIEGKRGFLGASPKMASSLL
jgi:hypothetical protein